MKPRLPLDSSTERWRWAVGYEGLYAVSSLGRVFSYREWGSNDPQREVPQAEIKGTRHEAGYTYFRFWKDGSCRKRYLHALVLEAFIGPRPQGHDVRHLDGNPENNAVSNLQWGTRQQNMLDKRAHGTSGARFSDADVADIRRRIAAGETQRSIAKSYDAHQGTISNLLRRAS